MGTFRDTPSWAWERGGWCAAVESRGAFDGVIDGYVEFESLMGDAIAGEARGVDGEDVLVVVKVALS